jgi:hypothetical protein
MASSIQINLGLVWFANVNPTVAPGVSAPLNQFLVRTDVAGLYYKAGAADTAWTQLASAGPSPTGYEIVNYVATGAEGTDFFVSIGVVMANDSYGLVWSPAGMSNNLIPAVDLPNIAANDRTTTQFRVVTSAALTAGDKLTFMVFGT